MAIVKTASVPQVGAGGGFTWLLDVTNNGPDPAADVVDQRHRSRSGDRHGRDVGAVRLQQLGQHGDLHEAVDGGR